MSGRKGSMQNAISCNKFDKFAAILHSSESLLTVAREQPATR